MSYKPVIALSGYSGWVVLNKTMERQKATFNASSQSQNLSDYFRAKIGSISSAEELVNDRRLLTVALGAFGLESDINSKAFIRKVLEQGTLDETSFANRLVDKSYYKLSAAFGFGDFKTPLSQKTGFADKILTQYQSHAFEAAVGDSNKSYRIAIAAQRDLPALAKSSSSENTKWYSVIGSKILSSFMRTALGLPASVSSLNVDQQLQVYKNKAKTMYGADKFADLLADGGMEKLTKSYVIRAELVDGITSTTATPPVLALFQGGASGNAGNTVLSLLL
ncbi:DUF1217 domain-containing protein [Paenirhodobacter sp.]|uniref:DUF1217 domain-containing protein n=1 Tax=Paenirhodobacter sp. TaxID=1965326 RepID=UPI003B410D24